MKVSVIEIVSVENGWILQGKEVIRSHQTKKYVFTTAEALGEFIKRNLDDFVMYADEADIQFDRGFEEIVKAIEKGKTMTEQAAIDGALYDLNNIDLTLKGVHLTDRDCHGKTGRQMIETIRAALKSKTVDVEALGDALIKGLGAESRLEKCVVYTVLGEALKEQDHLHAKGYLNTPQWQPIETAPRDVGYISKRYKTPKDTLKVQTDNRGDVRALSFKKGWVICEEIDNGSETEKE